MHHKTRIATAALLFAAGTTLAAQQDGFKLRSAVELITISATVSDSGGRFVRGLSKEDFVIYDDDQPQPVSHFAAERVPVSLGIVLDTSGSMAGDKMDAARQALNRFLFDLLGPEDEVFLYGFSNTPVLLQGWTTDRQRVARALDRARPNGGTALYDAVAEALPLTERGKHRKKALVIISDGNDTSSTLSIRELRQMIRESEALVYAIGIDAQGGGSASPPIFRPPQRRPNPFPLPQTPIPFPIPGGRQRWPPAPKPQPQPPTTGGWGGGSRDDRVNVTALRDLTDDSGGRTEIVRSTRDLDPATAGIADELSQQYFLGYTAPGHADNRWHAIRVEVPKGRYVVRARKGYVAS